VSLFVGVGEWLLGTPRGWWLVVVDVQGLILFDRSATELLRAFASVSKSHWKILARQQQKILRSLYKIRPSDVGQPGLASIRLHPNEYHSCEQFRIVLLIEIYVFDGHVATSAYLSMYCNMPRLRLTQTVSTQAAGQHCT
jgi:hypothetical protein